MDEAACALPASVGDALREGRSRLQAACVAEPGLEASLLLSHVLAKTRGQVYADPRAGLSRAKAAEYLALVQRRCHREPTAYITGSKSWRDLDLYVDRNVLIPRPETELLADLAIQITHELALPRAVVADIGTGSGALAIAIARAVPKATVYALDNARSALRVARCNVDAFAPGNVQVLESDLLAALPEPAQVVVANLPYIPSGEIAQLAPELAFEPRSALDGGADGLRPIAALLEQAGRCAHTPRALILECGHNQAPAIRALATAIWKSARISVHHDLAGVGRMVTIRSGGVRSHSVAMPGLQRQRNSIQT
jgi:release factor glutamine methyltransferase